MIAYLKGSILFRGSRFVILDVGGVGYKIYLSSDALRAAPEKGGEAFFYTHFHSREDTTELYGFRSYAELEFFELLISISGVGPRSALAVMGLSSLDSLRRAIGSGDVQYLTKVSGIGRKTAEKIILELKDKMASVDGASEEMIGVESDVLDALQALGYSLREARDALKEVPAGASSREERIANALRALGKK